LSIICQLLFTTIILVLSPMVFPGIVLDYAKMGTG